MECLYNIGVRGKSFQWFQSYLNNRKQFFQINNEYSTQQLITCGVPQGSVLGPILFLIYINSISNLKLKVNIKLFADDTTIIYYGEDIPKIYTDIQYDLKIISIWLQSYKLSLNYEKSKFMFITKNQLNDNFLTTIKFNNREIKYSKTIKFLGLHLDENLSWKKHIEHLRKYIAPIIGILYKARNYIRLRHLKNIYFSLIYSKLQYLNPVWGTVSISTLKPLKTLQNKMHISITLFRANNKPIYP